MDVFGVRTIKIVGASSTTIGTDGTLLGVVVGLQESLGVREHLEEIHFTTSSVPAGAGELAVATSPFSILSGTGDLGIQGPNGGHIAIEARAVLVLGHAEFEEEDLFGSAKSVYKGRLACWSICKGGLVWNLR